MTTHHEPYRRFGLPARDAASTLTTIADTPLCPWCTRTSEYGPIAKTHEPYSPSFEKHL